MLFLPRENNMKNFLLCRSLIHSTEKGHDWSTCLSFARKIFFLRRRFGSKIATVSKFRQRTNEIHQFLQSVQPQSPKRKTRFRLPFPWLMLLASIKNPTRWWICSFSHVPSSIVDFKKHPSSDRFLSLFDTKGYQNTESLYRIETKNDGLQIHRTIPNQSDNSLKKYIFDMKISIAACALLASNVWAFTIPASRTAQKVTSTSLFAEGDDEEGPILNRWSRWVDRNGLKTQWQQQTGLNVTSQFPISNAFDILESHHL